MLGFIDRMFERKTPPAEPAPLNAVFASEVGLVRKDNQDNAMVSVRAGVFCVADGMGGGAEGAKASEMVCEDLKASVHMANRTLDALVDTALVSLVETNAAIHRYAKEKGYAQMGATATVLVFDPVNRTTARTLNVGDSSIYRIRGGLSRKLTRDHRLPGSNTLTMVVGGAPVVYPDITTVDVCPGDRFLLCSDGVSEVVSAARMAAFVGCGKIEDAAERLASEVMKAGAPDNFTFIIVEA